MASSPLDTTTIIPSRRRGSTGGSTGLDYSSCLRVDEDISSRVRSLLLSRNDRRPPRTPNSSVEHLHDCLSDTKEVAASFDFSTARSIAKQVRLETGRLSLPGPTKIVLDGATPEAESSATLERDKSTLSKRPTLRSTSSTNQLAINTKVLAADLSSIPSNAPEILEKKFKLPRRVLNDNRKRAITVPQPRARTILPSSSKDARHPGSKSRPRNDSHTKSQKYVETMERQKSIELLGYKYNAETSDLACFMSGCSPGPEECEKHPRHQSYRSKTMPPAAPFPTLTDGNFDKALGADAESYSWSHGRDGVADNLDSNSIGATSTQSLHSSNTSTDAFPHAVLSQKIASKATPLQSFTTRVVTNFVLPGPKALKNPPKMLSKQDILKESSNPQVFGPSTYKIQPISTEGTTDPCQSDICESCESKNPSLYSTASRTSAYRHALLKSSVPDNQFLDIGPPVPAVLSPVNSMSIQVVDNGLETTLQKYLIKQQPSLTLLKSTSGEVLKAPVSGHITNLSKAAELAVRVRERVHDNSENGHQGTGCDKDASGTRVSPLNMSYWGFDPPGTAPELDALSPSHGGILPDANAKESEFDEDKAALAQAAKDADNYLRRSSRRSGFSCQGSITSIDLQDAELQNPANSDLKAMPAEENVDTIDAKSAWKMSNPWKKDAKLEYSLIPMRGSSRQQGTTRPAGDTNLSTVAPTKDEASKKSSLLSVKSQSNPNLSSTSSMDVFSSSATPSNQEIALANDPTLQSKYRSNARQGRRNTLHWLREFLISNGPYESRLTALPPRTRRLQNSSGGGIVSRTAPVLPIQELYREITPDTYKGATCIHDFTLTKPVEKSGAKKGPSVTETFSKTICDLEDLLNEALHIAKQAADHRESEHVPGKVQVDRDCEALKQDRDDAASLTSIHESLLSGSESTISDASDDEVLFEEVQEQRRKSSTERNAVVSILDQAEAMKRGVARPPTGRAATPFPPASFDRASASPTKSSISNRPAANIQPTQNQAAERFSSSDFVTTPIASPHFKEVDPFTDKRMSGGQRENQKVSPGTISPPPNNTQVEFERVEYILGFPSSALINGRVRALSGPSQHAPRQSSLLRTSSGPAPMGGITSRRQSPTRIIRGQTFAWQDVDPTKFDPCSTGESVTQASGQSLSIQATFPERSDYSQSFDGSYQPESEEIHWDQANGASQQAATGAVVNSPHEAIELRDVPAANLPQLPRKRTPHHTRHIINLKGRSHVSLRDHKGFSLSRSHKRQTIARDWSPARKRFSATVACISTALVGILVGIYAGEVPAIQYYVVDFHHAVILGNVFFFLGLAIPTFFFWPLPLLHGRKPYILGAMTLAMPLLFPQALVVGQFRSPYEVKWRVCLLLPRALMGFCLGFANINFKATLTDLFGASLQSSKPHQEVVDEFDVRRHGGGMGVWLGIWTWCCIGSIGIGFLIGAGIINHLNPAWGFYASICIIAGVLLLNVVSPEVRRSAYRRSIAEVKNGDQVSRRLARGEVKMHMVQTGPRWWGEEFHYGVVLSLGMLRQPGFLVMALYVAWMYGQMVLVIVLLGSLTSKWYNFKSPFVGLSVAAVPIGALLSVPFQKASFFSRSRKALQDTDDDTLSNKLHWSSHMVRRAVFILVLPFAGLAYTLTSTGPPLPFVLPIVSAGLIGFLSNLAMAECHGIIMETFDTSDLQPGMTGRPRGKSGERTAAKRTNYSSFPRVTSAVAITEGLGYLFAAAATGVGGVAQRRLGQQAATGVMAGILLVLSLLLLGVLVRFKEVQIIPDCKTEEMERWHSARKASLVRRKSGLEAGGVVDDEPWRPVIIGNPTHSTRRMCVLELGSLSRFSEIRRRNQLVDEESLEARHPNWAALGSVRRRLREKEGEVRGRVVRSVSGSVRSMRSMRSMRNRFSGEGRLSGELEAGKRIDEVVGGGEQDREETEGNRRKEKGKGRVGGGDGSAGRDKGNDYDGRGGGFVSSGSGFERGGRGGSKQDQKRIVDGGEIERVSDLGGVEGDGY